MRSTTSRIVVIVCITTAAGCSKRVQSSAKAEPDFDPKLILKWPGSPSESRQALPAEAGELKVYSATFTDKRADGLMIFSANVMEYPEKMLQGQEPKELIAAYVFGSRKDETSRNDVEHGPKKYPGLNITTRSVTSRGKPLIGRQFVVMAGPRLYAISVSCTNEDLMRGPEAKAFFDSFDIGE